MMDEAEIRRQLEAARKAYARDPTEANARECERLYVLTDEGKKWAEDLASLQKARS